MKKLKMMSAVLSAAMVMSSVPSALADEVEFTDLEEDAEIEEVVLEEESFPSEEVEYDFSEEEEAIDSERETIVEETAVCIEPANESSGIAIDEANFPDEYFRAYISANIDNGDGYLSEAEVQNCTNLIIWDGRIESLEGIEFLTEIESLYFNCDASEVDLSKNNKLECLSCPNCRSLTELDVSGCVSLESLSCPECFQLKSLVFTGCTNLKTLDCHWTNIQYIDISDCENLVEIIRNAGALKPNNENYCSVNWDSHGFIAVDLLTVVETRTNTDGWHQYDNGIKYYIVDGIIVTGWSEIQYREDEYYWYYFDSNGEMQTSWEKVGKKWYYFDENGRMQTGWMEIDGVLYYLGPSMATGWADFGQIGNPKWYYFDSHGQKTVGWKKISNKWYYFDSEGIMLTGWQQISDNWYYLGDVNSGAMVTGWQKIRGVWYFFNGGGDMKTGWLNYNGKWYYLNSSGAMVRSTSMKIGSKIYRFDSNGVCQNP